jgi:PD-(D/E)XK nuclease superfamily
MSLFNRLLKLHNGSTPLEDFFTELVAHLFSTNKEILYVWLKYLDLLETEANLDVYISTQQTFERLSHHFSDSRPDIIIELVDGTNRDIIFIESKIGSSEGCNQLQRYAEILDKLPDFRNKYLIYITRDFEPKERGSIFQEIPKSKVYFKQARWHQFYQFLKTQADSMLVEEIIKFMQEHQMAHNNQFSSIDVIALANFTKSIKLMEQTMWGEVSQKFNQVLGSMLSRAMTRAGLHNNERYLMYSRMSDKWWCGLGFMLDTSNSTDYPTVYLTLEVDPKSQRREEIIAAMKAICKQPGWQGYDLDNSKAWSGIVLGRSLQSFLSEDDHIVSIQKFFLKSLDELSEIKSQYNYLPWDSSSVSGDISDDPNSIPSTSIN